MSEAKDVATRDILQKMEAMQGSLSDSQRAQVLQLVDEHVDERIAARLNDSKYRPAPGSNKDIAGSRYEAMGLTGVDVQLARGILEDAQQRGLSKKGPSEELLNLTTAIQERVIADEGLDMRAMDTSDTTALIGVSYQTEVWKAAQESAVILPRLRSYQMKAKTDYIPVFGAPPRPQAYPESVTDDAADYDTQDVPFARVSVTAAKFGMHLVWSGEMEEESLINFVPALREQLTAGMGIYGDEAVISADDTISPTGNINSDDAQMPALDLLTQYDGIRHVGLVDNTGNKTDAGGTLTYAMLTGLRTKCIDRTRRHNWGFPANPADFIYVTGPEGEDVIANLDEVITVDKFGERATIVQGQVARIGQNPVLVSMAVPLTEADGKVSATAVNNTKSQVVGFNTNAVAVGVLRQMTVETYRIPRKDQNGIILFWRQGLARFRPATAASSMEWAAVAYNFS